jgi:hypothetical protein
MLEDQPEKELLISNRSVVLWIHMVHGADSAKVVMVDWNVQYVDLFQILS